MPCKDCQRARESDGGHTLYCPLCLWCGARLIRRIGRLQITQAESQARRRKVLADWMDFGHTETDLRTLAKTDLPLEPVGWTRDGEPAPPTKGRRR